MLYGEIEVGDILEWKTFGGQSTKLLVTAHGEILKYGDKKGDPKKIIPAVYVRALEAFDDDPQLVELGTLRQNAKRVEVEPETGTPENANDGENVTAFDAKREDDSPQEEENSVSLDADYADAPTPDYEKVYDENPPPTAADAKTGILFDDPTLNKQKSKTFS